jgi:thiamine-phosphate pyrophosphorylase
LKVIIISDPEAVDQEAVAINALFEEGLQTFHVRKPTYEKTELENVLLSIKPKFLKRIVIHSHYELIDRYNLKGIHFPERILLDFKDGTNYIKKLQKKGMTVSTSFHSIEMLSNNAIPFNYVFLSPVFESISKPGYKGNIDITDLPAYVATTKRRPELIALGGIEKSKILEIENIGFDGFALLGNIWNDYKESADLDRLIEKFKNIIEITNLHARQA